MARTKRPQTFVFVSREPPTYEAVLHRRVFPYEVGYLTEQEIVNDSVAILSDGVHGQFIGQLPERALCGRRLRDYYSGDDVKLAANKKCPGCFPKEKKT